MFQIKNVIVTSKDLVKEVKEEIDIQTKQAQENSEIASTRSSTA